MQRDNPVRESLEIGSSREEAVRHSKSLSPLRMNPSVFGLWLGLLTTPLSLQFSVAYMLAPIAGVLMGTSLTFVWLDGIITEMGLRHGLEEANPIIRALQNVAGHGSGLILSRILLSGLIAYTAIALQYAYPLLLITLFFAICTLSNLARTAYSRYS